MPVFFLFCGVAFLVSALRGTQGDLINLLKDDLTGTPNFGLWVGAIVLIGAFGYSRTLRPISNGLLTLVFVGIILSNKGVIAKLYEVVK